VCLILLIAAVDSNLNLRFLLAPLHIDTLAREPTVGHIELALQNLPTKLDETYQQAMTRIENQGGGFRDLAKKVLFWVIHAKRLLSTAELQHAVAVEPGKPKLNGKFIPNIEILCSICAGLVTVDTQSDVIRLVHYTTQEYLERTQMTWFPNAQRDIASICITYLAFDAFEAGFCPADKEFETRLQQNPFYDYAARNWAYHVRSASTVPDYLISNFLDSDAKVSAAGQAMRVCGNLPGYSQRVPREITGMHLAACFGLEDVMTLLLKSGHNPDAKDGDAQTPLLWAASYGHEMLVELLLREKPDINISDASRRTALHYAATHGWMNALNLLLKAQADIEARDSLGQTPLLIAAANAQTEAVQLLINTGANAETVDGKRRGALHLAISHPDSKAETARLLLMHHAPADTADSDNMTPLHYTVMHNHTEIAKALIEHGVPIDIRIQRRVWRSSFQEECRVYTMVSESSYPRHQVSNVNGLTPLHYAALVGSSTMTSFFLSRGADPNAVSYDGETPLHLALHRDLQGLKYEDGWTDSSCRLEILFEFIDFEDDKIDKVHAEVAEGLRNVINTLLSHHATNVRIQDNKGASLLHVVRYGSLGYPFIIPELLQRGLDSSATIGHHGIWS
jgi:ankyrin repeat protein